LDRHRKGVVSQLIKKSVLENAQPENRFFFLDFILSILVKNRNKKIVLEKLKRELIIKFYLLPVRIPQILKTIDIWKAQN
jgi:hypothetical protein